MVIFVVHTIGIICIRKRKLITKFFIFFVSNQLFNNLGNEDDFRRLLIFGANINATDDEGNTAILLAAKKGIWKCFGHTSLLSTVTGSKVMHIYHRIFSKRSHLRIAEVKWVFHNMNCRQSVHNRNWSRSEIVFAFILVFPLLFSSTHLFYIKLAS